MKYEERKIKILNFFEKLKAEMPGRAVTTNQIAKTMKLNWYLVNAIILDVYYSGLKDGEIFNEKILERTKDPADKNSYWRLK